MTERPAPVDTLDRWLGAFRLAHEAVFVRYRRAVELGRATDHIRGLLAESADIALRATTALTSTAKALARDWDEQRVLTPDVALETLGTLDAELARIEPEIRRLLERHAEIARSLQRLLDDR